MNYKWKPKDDLIALLLFKLGANEIACAKAAQEIGCPKDSLKKRIQNLEYLKHKTGKMSHVSAQTKAIFDKFDQLI